MEKPIANKSDAAPQQASAQVGTELRPTTAAPKAMAAETNSAAEPNRNADVPKYFSCMASDSRINKETINAINARVEQKE